MPRAPLFEPEESLIQKSGKCNLFSHFWPRFVFIARLNIIEGFIDYLAIFTGGLLFEGLLCGKKEKNWYFKGLLPESPGARSYSSAAVLRSEREGQNVKWQSSNDKVQMERSLGERKKELWARIIFFRQPAPRPRAGKTQFWVKGGLNAWIVEKICLSGEERVFSRRQARGEIKR